MTNYHVENQWGTSAWADGGFYILGSRSAQGAIEMNITSADNGKTFTGTMTYENEGSIAVKATQTSGNCYSVQNQWGGSSAPWHHAAGWIIGCRNGQQVVSLQYTSKNGGKTLEGKMQYDQEGDIAFKASQFKY